MEKSTIVLIIINQQYKNPVCQIFKISIKNWKNSKIDKGISEYPSLVLNMFKSFILIYN